MKFVSHTLSIRYSNGVTAYEEFFPHQSPYICLDTRQQLLCISHYHHFLLQVTRVDGEKLLPYRTQLVQTLQLTLRLRCKQGYTLACNLLHHILRSTALTYPTDYCSVPGGFNKPLQEYLPIKVL